ncbi:MAG: putative 3-oxoacyl-(acyl-carrier-protein) reductase [Pseudomonas sp.]|nr:putative 3-oxoacyl-(acyl-carrier-protein) reductase [Pseudomonas sp.]
MSNKDSKTVVITGASSGIGFALAEAFLARGYNVVGNARTLDRLQAAATQFTNAQNFLAVAGDISKPATAKALFDSAIQAFGKVDILINNAGIFSAKPFVDYTPEDLEAQLDTNLRGFVFPSQAAAAHMIERKQGHIISISAAVALQANRNVPATLPVLIKGGINQAVRALALELSPHNIMVTAVAPGIIDTPLHDPKHAEFLKSLQPVGHVGEVQDIVNAVLYLADAAFTTGVVLAVDGGMSTGTW